MAAWARASAARGSIVEIGSYCGRSTLYLAQGAREAGGRVIAVDHHRGSEEHQPGWDWHDPDLWNQERGRLDTLPRFRQTLFAGGVEDVVTPLVATSAQAGALVAGPIGMVFLDGSHTYASALSDWRVWGARVASGGCLAIHDVFPTPSHGGRPPHEVHLRAVASGLFDPIAQVGSLSLLLRLG